MSISTYFSDAYPSALLVLRDGSEFPLAQCFKRNPSILGCDHGVLFEKLAKEGGIHKLKSDIDRKVACKHLVPKAPDIADILGNYAQDYVSANRAGSFEDFASEMGYDEDSRKAEEIYRACLAQRKPLMQLGLSMAEIEKIADYASQF
jgi:hypothetical protein